MPNQPKRCVSCVTNNCRECRGTIEINGGEACACGHHELGIPLHYAKQRGNTTGLTDPQVRWNQTRTKVN